MILSAIIKSLIDSGATSEMILSAVIAYERAEAASKEQDIERKRKINAERQARYRAVKREESNARNAMSRDVTVTSVTSPNGFPDPSLTPKEKTPKGVKKKKPLGVNLFEWELANGEITYPRLQTWLEKEGYTQIEGEKLIEKFRNSCMAKSLIYSDFLRAFKYWNWPPPEISIAIKNNKQKRAFL